MGLNHDQAQQQQQLLHPQQQQQQQQQNYESTPFFRLQSPKEVQAGFYIFLLTGICAVSSLLFGYDTGVVSGALLSIRNDLKLSEWEQELIVSITTIGAVVGSLSGGYFNERVGRRPVILLSSVIFTVGAVVMGVAPDFLMLTVGRAIIGLAIGFSSMTVPIYIAEAAPSSIRGRLVTINCIFITGGQFVAGMVDGGFAEVPGGWRYMLGVAAVPAAMQFVGVLFLPESPRWLVAKGRVEEARDVLGRLRASEDIGFEMAEIEEDVAATSSLPTAGLKDLWASPPIRRAVILGCGLMLLQQLSGINTVMYYSASIYNMAGFSDTASIWLAGFTALAQFVGMLANMALVEKWGRRTLVLTSLSLVTLSLIAIGASFYLAMASSAAVKVVTDPMCATVSNIFVGSFGVTTCFQCVENAACGFCPALQACMPGNKTMDSMGSCPVSSGGGRGMEGGWAYGVCENEYGYMSVASMVLYLFTFGLGMGAMPWTICAEIFPLHVRSLANSLTTSVNWVGNVVISATFLTVASPHVLTQYGAFWLYALIAFSGLVGLSFTLPETKGVPLEEIEALFIKPGDRIPGVGEEDEGRREEEEEELSVLTVSPTAALTGGARGRRRMSVQNAAVEGGNRSYHGS
jgi:SP family myo-inositol transporter-like MFS transporter 13